MAYDAIAYIIENYGVDEEMAEKIFMAAVLKGRKVLTQDDFENWWIPHVFEKLMGGQLEAE